jgi:hypothetical protein
MAGNQDGAHPLRRHRGAGRREVVLGPEFLSKESDASVARALFRSPQ